MLIIEGVRRCGKSHTIKVLKKSISQLIFYKDLGMRMITNKAIDPDIYAIGRDLAYAQFLPNLCRYGWYENFVERLFFDRAYWSSYVYGQAWRNNYSKTFWKTHIKLIEDTYGDFLKKIKIIFITLTKDDFQRIEDMDRNEDQWEKTHTDYRKQYDLYMELFNISKIKTHTLDGFKDDSYISSKIRSILEA